MNMKDSWTRKLCYPSEGQSGSCQCVMWMCAGAGYRPHLCETVASDDQFRRKFIFEGCLLKVKCVVYLAICETNLG